MTARRVSPRSRTLIGDRHCSGIFLVSLGILTIEISLTRLFSYAISYHFAYLTIATALLGFGSAGSIVASFPQLWGSSQRRMVYASSFACLTTSGALAFSSVVRFNPVKLGHNPSALAILGLYYVVITIPFFLGGITVATIFSVRAREIGRIYAWDLLGASLGCALAVPLIWAVETPSAVVVGALGLGAGAVVFAGADHGLRRLAGISLVATLICGGFTVHYAPFPPSPAKFLSQFLASPGVKRLFTRWTPINRVDVVGWERSEHSWRSSYAASGVSKTFHGRGPEFRMIGYDGGSFAVMYQYSGKPKQLDMFRHHIMTAPYTLLEEPKVLIIGLGGGADALAGIANGAGPMTGIELNPVTVRLGKKDFRAFNGDLFNSPRLKVVSAEARHWVDTSSDKYDLIVLNSIDTLSALSSGAYVLAESYLYTREAFTRYLQHLSTGGIYALLAFDNNGLAGPTFIILRFASTLQAALNALGVADPKAHIVILASRDRTPFVTMLTKKTPFTAAEMTRLTAFASREGFEFWHRPDRRVDHQVGAYLWMSSAEREAFLDDHYLALRPASDSRPFFFNFYKWRSLLRRDPDDPGTTPATGQRMLLVMLVQAIIVAVVMILWPLRRLKGGASLRKPFGLILYFSALGIGFIFIEISLMQRFVLFLGFPTYSLSVVLFSLLVFTALGSALTTRFRNRSTRKPIYIAAALGVVSVLFLIFVPGLIQLSLREALGTRIVISVLIIAPMGMLLGMFFPLGIQIVERVDSRLVPWAWAVNGCSTVVGTILAVIVAIAVGFDVVMIAAVVIYFAGAVGLMAGQPVATGQ